MTQLLVIGDDRQRNEYLRNNLEADGYEVTIANTAADGLQAIDATPPDLVILADPAMRRAVRDRTSDIPVMVLRPMGIAALQARVLALLRRTRPPGSNGPSWIHIGDLDIHPGERRVRRGGSAVKLTAKEFGLLLTLIRNRDRTVSHAELLDAVWHRAPVDPTKTIGNHVNSLRRKLCRNTRRSLIIVTEPQKAGYRLFIDDAAAG